MSFACLMPFDSALDFEGVAGVVGEGVGADQQQNDVGGVDLPVDGLGAIVAGKNLVTAPTGDDALIFLNQFVVKFQLVGGASLQQVVFEQVV